MTETRQDAKGRSYEELLARLDAARKEGFHLEASWIAYAVVEDRIDSALGLTGGIPPKIMLGKKLEHLRNRLSGDAELRKATAAGQVLDEVERWKNSRNPLMHSMAAESLPWEDLEKNAAALSADGRETVRNLCSAIMRLKKLKQP